MLSYSVAEAGTAAIGLLILWGSVEGFIGYILLGGVALSMTLVVVGVGWHWLATGKLGVSYLIKGVNLLWFLSAIAQGTSSRAARRDPLVNLGIGVLMLTPYMRVLGSALFFAFMARNWKYTVSPPLSSAC
ncbi:MAG: DUF1634 domain-containing protein [Armatimonadota bacterium]|nr:DUF1634 domain-containing protein [Armatimonadota bacterium]